MIGMDDEEEAGIREQNTVSGEGLYWCLRPPIILENINKNIFRIWHTPAHKQSPRQPTSA